MTTLTLTHVPSTRDDSTSTLVDLIHRALAAHLDCTVALTRTFPAPRLTTSASREDVEAAAMVYLPGVGVKWAVSA